MSRYTTSSSRYESSTINQLHSTAVQNSDLAVQALSLGWSSQRIAAARKMAATALVRELTLADLHQVRTRLENVLPEWERLSTASLTAVSTAFTKLESLQQPPQLLPTVEGFPVQTTALPVSELTAVSGLLDDAFVSAELEVSRMEREVTSAAAALALPELGYFITRADSDQATAFEARRDHEVLLLVIKDGGLIETDHAGLNGDACGERQEALSTQMAHHGVHLQETSHIRHDDPNGGAQIALAARERAGSLAAGAVALASRQLAKSQRNNTKTSTRPRVTEGGVR